MNNSKSIPVSLNILNKEYVLACPEEERERLLISAQHLTQKIQQVRDGGKVVSNERIVVISALNIVHECFQQKQETENLLSHIAQLEERISLALAKIKQLTI